MMTYFIKRTSYVSALSFRADKLHLIRKIYNESVFKEYEHIRRTGIVTLKNTSCTIIPLVTVTTFIVTLLACGSVWAN